MTEKDSGPDPLSNAVDGSGQPSRRSVIKRAGIATVWAVPTVQTLNMVSAAAAGSPPPDPTGSGTITGQVTDASNGSPIPGATVSVDTGESDTTDGSGMYTIPNVPAGNREVTAQAVGYLSSTRSAIVTDGNTTVVNFALAPAGGGAIRAVLSWTAIPRDLDLHVSGPVSGNPGARFHVYYSNAAVRDDTGDPYCELDVDDVDGNGPETQTITVSDSEGDYVAGTYRVWVHNFSDQYDDNNTFASGDISLTLFDRNSQVGSYSQSAATGDDSKFIWLVVQFHVDDAGNVSAVTPLQTMADGSESTQF